MFDRPDCVPEARDGAENALILNRQNKWWQPACDSLAAAPNEVKGLDCASSFACAQDGAKRLTSLRMMVGPPLAFLTGSHMVGPMMTLGHLIMKS
jgi:hypothetical protein